MITGETLIKGLFYFILKARGGKFESKKQVAGKDGKLKWVYKYAKKKGEKSKASPEKQSKQKADKKSMNDNTEISRLKTFASELEKGFKKVFKDDLSSEDVKTIKSLLKESKKKDITPEEASKLRGKISYMNNVLDETYKNKTTPRLENRGNANKKANREAERMASGYYNK